MEVIYDHRHFPKRRQYDEICNRPIANPIHERRLQIVVDTVIRGRPIYVGSVISVDISEPEGVETYQLLRNSLKAIRVKNDVPLVDVPAPAPPAPPAAPPPLPRVDVVALASEMIRQLQLPKGKEAR